MPLLSELTGIKISNIMRKYYKKKVMLLFKIIGKEHHCSEKESYYCSTNKVICGV